MEKNVRRYFFSVFVQDLFAIPLAKLFIKLKLKANYVTLIGLFSSIASGLLYLDHSYILGSFLFFVALEEWRAEPIPSLILEPNWMQ